MTTTIETNDRFDRLTNLDISTHYSDRKIYLCRSDLISAFAYWAHYQSPYDTPDLREAIKAFAEYISPHFEKIDFVEFGWEGLRRLLEDKEFEKIEPIRKLNDRANGREGGMSICTRFDKPHPDDDFIDLGALAHNIFYMVFRQEITHS